MVILGDDFEMFFTSFSHVSLPTLRWGYNALQAAAMAGQSETVQMLLEVGPLNDSSDSDSKIGGIMSKISWV